MPSGNKRLVCGAFATTAALVGGGMAAHEYGKLAGAAEACNNEAAAALGFQPCELEGVRTTVPTGLACQDFTDPAVERAIRNSARPCTQAADPTATGLLPDVTTVSEFMQDPARSLRGAGQGGQAELIVMHHVQGGTAVAPETGSPT